MMSFAGSGPCRAVVAAGLSILAMGSALTLGWKGRLKWEPAEEDVPGAPQKVGGALAAISIALLWASMSELRYVATLTRLALILLGIGLLSLLVYIVLTSTLIYDKVLTRTRTIKIIGGLWLKAS